MSVTSRTPAVSWQAKRTTSEPSISVRRLVRSAITPATSEKIRNGTVVAAATRPTSVAPAPVASTAKGSATKVMRSPTWDSA